ncbi:MAG: hypothetical protein N3A59_04145 [Thermodesulfovibrionales bacterium]|nr:hypothetical protein [Thermodesulfovibrionales bacterium]
MKGEPKKFYPDYLSEIIVVITIAIEVLLILVFLMPPTIGRPIDLSKPFQAIPEWYFLWLYKLVSYFHGPFIFVGTVIIPLIFIFILIALPFFDRRRGGRLIASLLGSILLLSFVMLTLISIIDLQ